MVDSGQAYDWQLGNENVIPYYEFSLSYDPPGDPVTNPEGGWIGDDNLWGENDDGWGGGRTVPYLIQKNSEILSGPGVLTLALADNLPVGSYVVALEFVPMHGAQQGGGGYYHVSASIEGAEASINRSNDGYNGVADRLFLGNGSYVKYGQAYDVYTEPNFVVSDGTIGIALGTAYTHGGYMDNWFSFNGLSITRVSGAPNPGPALYPDPNDRATVGGDNLVLSWTAGDYATDHDVYFGSSFVDVNSANRSSNAFRTNKLMPDTTYDAGTLESLEFGRTYYWRVDANDPANTYTGWVWSFTIGCPGGYLAGDLNDDCVIDFKDFTVLVDEWGKTVP